MKYMSITAGYTWTDYKTSAQIAKDLKITQILDKLMEYKRSWIQRVNRMPRNRLSRVMKYYSLTGRRNHGRPLKRLLDTWDRNGSTSGPTPWKIYYDDDLSVWNTFVLFVAHLHMLGGLVDVVTWPLLENWGIFFRFQTVPRDVSSLRSARNGSEGQTAFFSLGWLSALWQCGCGGRLTTHLHLEPRLRMGGLVTPLLHGFKSEKSSLSTGYEWHTEENKEKHCEWRIPWRNTHNLPWRYF